MDIKDPKIFKEADQILKEVYGPTAQFREGQYEAIEATMNNRRTLVVQKTGWGKSLVYFICTKLYRSKNRGMTMVISPLLVLMENQKEMAEKLGLHCATLNSSIKGEERSLVLSQMENNELDLIFITPETLQKEEIQSAIRVIKLGLFVIDEAHCISDWGHDFRLAYGSINQVLINMPSTVSVLATTATANNRVVNDLKKQLGDNVYISRGPLTRDSLHIQILHLENQADRYAWLLDNLDKLPGTGIIYCLDRRDCDRLAEFLSKNGIPAKPYYSKGDAIGEEENAEAIEAFQTNSIKAIVATIKLGMGYDKGDIGFVIHFQSPSSIVAWYQQIGRAGRNLKDAYIFLMNGKEDDDINEYFINTAFPTRDEADATMQCINGSNGIKLKDIIANVNARRSRIDKTLYFMENEGFIRKEDSYYYPTTKRYFYDEPHYLAVTQIRRQEKQQMQQLLSTTECLSRFAVNCLDDPTGEVCGKCANCMGKDIVADLSISASSKEKAMNFIISRHYFITPRKRWPDSKVINYQLQKGICLSKYGDAGYGRMVARGKYPPPGDIPRFDNQLVEKAANVLSNLAQTNNIKHITFVPSLRSTLVKDFAARLAKEMKLEFVELLTKSDAPQQKTMENSVFQCTNAMESFQAKDMTMPKKVILVDDIIDSGWTLTVCGYKIMESGCEEVYPFALANSSHSNEEE